MRPIRHTASKLFRFVRLLIAKQFITTSLLLLFAGMYSCIDEINLQTDEVSEVLIIEGAIYNNGRFPEVKIRKSAAFAAGPEGVELPVSGAIVSISEIGGATLELTETEAGIYSTTAPVGTTGKDYQLQVELNGDTYQSLPETMPPTITIDALTWKTREETFSNSIGNLETRKIIILRANATLPQTSTESFLRYRIFGTYEYRERGVPPNLNPSTCFVDESIDFSNLALVDGRGINDGLLVDEPILEKNIDYRFAFNYCFTVVQQSISINAFNFWNSVRNEFERTGDIFEAPPAKAKGNVFNAVNTKNDVIGLFSAIATDTSKILVSGLELEGPRDQCLRFGSALPPACFDCLQIMNSSLIKPECF